MSSTLTQGSHYERPFQGAYCLWAQSLFWGEFRPLSAVKKTKEHYS